ncbi:acyl-CoA carboxylase subunit epsilon [Streptomyces sp. NPDC046215]|uniref:Acyl-CoA carboxylase subunit epsilon n=1 Tax=Streptomyces stramineus TaxID=173861 RepID=A0ABP3JIZ3_9ACTN
MSGSGESAFRIVRGRATDEELAATVVALLARLSAAAPEADSGRAPARRAWSAPGSRMTRRPAERGPGAWRTGLL